jgi:hypothetical protein
VARKTEPPQTTKKNSNHYHPNQSAKNSGRYQGSQGGTIFMSRKRSMPMLFNAATAGCSGETRVKTLELWD